jgi:hypothetical protein
MTADAVRDERTTSVENASYRWAFTVLVFGVLLDMMYRGMVKRGALPDWLSLVADDGDLLSLVIVSGVVGTFYQWRHKALGHVNGRRVLATMAIAALIAVALSRIVNH